MSEGLRVALVGGGSGGHIYPLVGLAQEVLARQPDAQVTFIGEVGRMEAELLPREGFAPRLLSLPPANAPLWKRALLGWRWFTAIAAARRLLREVRVQVVVGSGGQIGAPVLLAARREGIPRMILECNAVPGKANAWIARHARPDVVGIAMPKAREHFPPGLRIEETGYPLRPSVLHAERAKSAAALGLDPHATTLLVTTGSLGSERVNSALVELLPRLRGQWAEGLQILHLGGWRNAKTLAPEEVSKLAVRYRFLPYLHAMEQALAVADLVLGRAGATALAELTALGIPAILVPLPAADGHQSWNARWMADAGGALVVPDEVCTAERLEAELGGLLADPERLARMAAASRALGRPEATAHVVDLMLELARMA
ncbi:MAG: UDP-N-acetylglucosamine--N-acetylmuramyl-(pentapeptide) pyrophosphoryl-undecaprenol N-acetylglucosamine transferase [Armatimonadetes bacterium]|nr:UDP-N-acetylglucosamine--N-acetylmuramyl-(pentapeptide) pyrophosphoryl-undecaprenol N-acetylglucosamine transferase [Armatimonadota bacterium]